MCREKRQCRELYKNIVSLNRPVVLSGILLDVLVNLSFKKHTAGFEDFCKRVVRMIKTIRTSSKRS